MAAGAGGPVARTGRAHSCALADTADFAELPGRSRAALALRGWRGRSRIHIVGVAAILRRLQPGAPLFGGKILYLPVRDTWAGLARTAARRRRRYGGTEHDPRCLGCPHRSLQRIARGVAAHRARDAEDRDELHRRVNIMTFTHLDATLHPTMVDVGDKATTKRSATAEARVWFPPAAAAALRDSGLRSPKGPVFDTAIVAGVMGAKRTHELIPFCHALAL